MIRMITQTPQAFVGIDKTSKKMNSASSGFIRNNAAICPELISIRSFTLPGSATLPVSSALVPLSSTIVSGNVSFSKPVNATMSSPTSFSLVPARFVFAPESGERVGFEIKVPETSNVLSRRSAYIVSQSLRISITKMITLS